MKNEKKIEDSRELRKLKKISKGMSAKEAMVTLFIRKKNLNLRIKCR